MEAKDTVMSDEQIKTLIPNWIEVRDEAGVNAPPTILSGKCRSVNGEDRAIAQAQAEISFKAGIREVVRWIEEESALDVDDETSEPNGLRAFEDDDWQTQLKEWGIKEGKCR